MRDDLVTDGELPQTKGPEEFSAKAPKIAQGPTEFSINIARMLRGTDNMAVDPNGNRDKKRPLDTWQSALGQPGVGLD